SVEALAAGPGRERQVHVVLENDRNEARFLDRRAPHAAAQWNDDAHHALHLLATGEAEAYYRDYATRPAWYLGRALSQGFGYQGELSAHRGGEPRGEDSTRLPPEAFVTFLQNHDQVGNRAFGDRIAALAEPGCSSVPAASSRCARCISLAAWAPPRSARASRSSARPGLRSTGHSAMARACICAPISACPPSASLPRPVERSTSRATRTRAG